MYETIMVTIYGIASLIKNRVCAIITLLIGIAYLIINNYFEIDILKNIDINVLIILLCTYNLSRYLIKTNILNYLINLIVERVTTYKKLIFILCIFTFIISGFVNNYILISFMLPYIEEVIKKNNIKHKLLTESIIISSTLGSMSTLIGTSENIIISSYLKMNFIDFLFYDSRIGINIIFLILFFIYLFIINLLIKDEEFMGNYEEIEIKNKFNIYLYIIMVILLIIIPLFKIKYLSSVCIFICLLISIYKNKSYEKMDFLNIVFYGLMFIYVGLFKEMKFISLVPIYTYSNVLIYTIFFILSIILSLIFNPVFVFYFITLFIPYITLNTNINEMPLIYIVYFGLLMGILKNKKIDYKIIIFMLLIAYLLVAFLYF